MRTRSHLALPLALALALAPAACGHGNPAAVPACHGSAPPSTQVGVTHGTVKIRDDSAVPPSTEIALDAARTEYEPFQIVVAGGAAGVTELHVAKEPLVRDDDPSVALPAADLRLSQEARYNIRWASSTEGASGYWPDPLIPDVDAFDGEQRNAFVHFDIAPGQTRAVWVDVRVPDDQPAGRYTGTFEVTGAGLPATEITVRLRVRNFTLPSTATLASAFGLSPDAVTRAHFGGQWCSDFPADQTDALLAKYVRAALDDRITLTGATCGDPSGDLARFDQTQGTLLDGTAATELAGAHLTSYRNPSGAGSGMTTLASHFAARGWTGLFDYSCDEPPRACDLAAWPARAQAAHAAGIPNLVTTDLDYLTQQGWLDLVDIATPVAETMNDQSRAAWATFLARGPNKRLWWYQSCDSHGCGGCDASMATWDERHGMPSYVIDSDARQNRSMEWLSFIYDVSGELYYETAEDLQQGLDWDSGLAYCGFGGNGDGTLFYPGKPSDPRIGGTTDIPIESIRMKLIREGMEDYEYLQLYAQKFGRDAAVAEAKRVFPDVFGSKAHPADLLYQVREELADGIEGASTPSELDVPHAPGPVDLAGDLHELAAATPVIVAAGAGNATFRMVWDEDALYVAADVADPDVRVQGTGEDGPLYDGDAIEVLLDPALARTAAATAGDLQVIVNEAGDKYDARGAGATGDASYDIPGLAWHSQPIAGGYRIAVRIPWPAPVAADQRVGLDLGLDDLDASGLSYADWAQLDPFAQPSRWHAIHLVGAGGSCP